MTRHEKVVNFPTGCLLGSQESRLRTPSRKLKDLVSWHRVRKGKDYSSLFPRGRNRIKSCALSNPVGEH